MSIPSNIIWNQTVTRQSISATGAGISYNSSTGVITGSAITPFVFSAIVSFGANVAASVPTPEYGASQDTVVTRGTCSISAAKANGSTLFTLPAAAFPTATRTVSLNAEDAIPNAKFVLVQISTTGVVTVKNGPLANGDTLYLDSLCYTI